jgi:hypothetical protein
VCVHNITRTCSVSLTLFSSPSSNLRLGTSSTRPHPYASPLNNTLNIPNMFYKLTEHIQSFVQVTTREYPLKYHHVHNFIGEFWLPHQDRVSTTHWPQSWDHPTARRICSPFPILTRVPPPDKFTQETLIFCSLVTSKSTSRAVLALIRVRPTLMREHIIYHIPSSPYFSEDMHTSITLRYSQESWPRD